MALSPRLAFIELLPDEVLVTVFSHLKLESPSEVTTSLIVCHVCRRWRLVAVNYGFLWTPITPAIGRPELLDTVITRGGSRPMTCIVPIRLGSRTRPIRGIWEGTLRHSDRIEWLMRHIHRFSALEFCIEDAIGSHTGNVLNKDVFNIIDPGSLAQLESLTAINSMDCDIILPTRLSPNRFIKPGEGLSLLRELCLTNVCFEGWDVLNVIVNALDGLPLITKLHLRFTRRGGLLENVTGLSEIISPNKARGANIKDLHLAGRTAVATSLFCSLALPSDCDVIVNCIDSTALNSEQILRLSQHISRHFGCTESRSGEALRLSESDPEIEARYPKAEVSLASTAGFKFRTISFASSALYKGGADSLFAVSVRAMCNLRLMRVVIDVSLLVGYGNEISNLVGGAKHLTLRGTMQAHLAFELEANSERLVSLVNHPSWETITLKEMDFISDADVARHIWASLYARILVSGIAVNVRHCRLSEAIMRRVERHGHGRVSWDNNMIE
ncbi:unnamed protein product [Peniophora sp. CBMAI 1063]|nr:unnamed protein product [Peniophora sp. CBMAI 1063]